MRVKIYRSMKAAHDKPCPYCREIMTRDGRHGRWPSRDHILPRSAGGTLARNKLICCDTCNVDKGARRIWDWHAHLKKVGDPRADYVLQVIIKLYSLLGPTAYARSVGDHPSREVAHAKTSPSP